jgi:hypothetical protein
MLRAFAANRVVSGILAILLPAVLSVSSAWAADDDEGEWHLGVELGTDFPIHAGARLQMEHFDGFRMSFAVGLLPGAYVDVINSIVVAFGGYDEDEAELVASALQDSLVLRLQGGWRPLEDVGFYFEGGYTVATLGGGVASEDLLSTLGASGAGGPNVERSYVVESTLFILGAEVGWDWVLEGHWTVRASLGFVTTVASETTIVPGTTLQRTRFTDELTRDAANHLDGVYTAYVHAPIVGVAVGYRFY